MLADIRNLVNFRERLNKELQQAKAEITTILDRYFPEFLDVFKSVEGKAAMAALENFPFPADLLERTVEEVASVLREATNKRVGGRHAELLQESARNSVGIKDGAEGARIDLQYQLRRVKQILDECKLVETRLAELLKEIPYAGYLLTIPGMSILQVATVVSEVGDLSNYRSARQLIKLAGLNLVENSSGSHKGRIRISKRGRSKLRCALFRVALILVARTQEFSLLHHYYTTRPNNPLKGKQSLVAICCKLLRIIFALGQKKMVYDKNMVISQDHPPFKYMESAVKSKKAAA